MNINLNPVAPWACSRGNQQHTRKLDTAGNSGSGPARL